MATDIEVPRASLPLYRLTVRQFEKMIDAGILPGNAHIELLGGVLVARMTKNDPHNFVVGQLADGLRRVIPAGWFINEEKSLVTGTLSRPEPDIAVVRGRREDFRDRGPRAQDVALIAEVTDSSYAKDRGSLWRHYAAAGVPIYWIVNLPQRRVEVYSDPAGRGKSAAYRQSKFYGQDEEAPVLIEGREVGRVAVRDLLP